MIYILSDSQREAEYCARTIFKLNSRKDFKRISSEVDLFGVQDQTIFVYGEYHKTLTNELRALASSRHCNFYRICDV